VSLDMNPDSTDALFEVRSGSTDWPIRRIGDVCSSIVPGRNKPKSFDGDIPWVTTGDIQGGVLNQSALGLAISEAEIKSCGTRIVPTLSVVMTCVGEFGNVALARNRLVINQQLHAFVCGNAIIPEYLVYALSSQKKMMDRLATTTAVPYLNKDNCESILIPVPPLPEQRKIAEILSCWDEGIKTGNKIISHLEKVRWEYLRLLSRGSEKVGTRQLRDVLELVYGKSPKDILNPKGRYPVVGTGGVVGRTDQALSNNPSVIVGRKGTINKPLLIESPFWAIDTTYYVKPKEPVDLYWLLILFQSLNLASYNESSGVPSLLRETLYSILIPFPAYVDQIRIGTFFRALDEEIVMQNNLMRCFRLQKQALMQNLLTGKIRVKL
jgi:restriction endonuclease S subunit